jgi:hypothetical protein
MKLGGSFTVYKQNINLNRNHYHQLGANVSSRQAKGKVMLEFLFTVNSLSTLISSLKVKQ